MQTINRAEQRAHYLATIADLRPTLEAHIAVSEANRTLAPEIVRALDDSGLWGIVAAHEVGGIEGDPMLHMDLIEALTYIYPSCGWCYMIGTTSLGILTAFLQTDAIEELLQHTPPRAVAGSFLPSGVARPVKDGYRVSGRWRFASGIYHSSLVWGGAVVVNDDASPLPTPPISVAFAVNEVQVHDNWWTAGLRGTGSCDFSADDLFVPSHHIFVANAPDQMPSRGGPKYYLPVPALIASEHTAFALGIAHRALDELQALILRTRGKFRAIPLAERQVVHRAFADFDLKLRAVTLLAYATYEEIWQEVTNAKLISSTLHARSQAVAVQATELATEIATQAFRYGGASALYQPNILEILLRDINAASQHIFVSDVGYERYGQAIIGLNDDVHGPPPPSS